MVKQVINLTPGVDDPGRPRDPAPADQRQRALARQFRRRAPGQIGILLIKHGQAYRVGDAGNLLNYRPQRARHLQLSQFNHRMSVPTAQLSRRPHRGIRTSRQKTRISERGSNVGSPLLLSGRLIRDNGGSAMGLWLT